MDKRRSRLNWPGCAAVSLLLAAATGAFLLPLLSVQTDPAQIRAWVQGQGMWGPVLVVALEFAQVVVSPITGHAVEAASGYLFGPWLGTLYCVLGVGAGSVLSFLLARKFGRPLVARLISPQDLARFDDLAERGGSLFFFLIWLLPLLPDDLACLAAGLTPMPIRQFLFLLIAGRLPGIWASNWVGAYAARLEPALLAGLLAGFAALAAVLWRFGKPMQGAALRWLQKLSRTEKF